MKAVGEPRASLAPVAVMLALLAPLLTRIRPARLCVVLRLLSGGHSQHRVPGEAAAGRVERSLAVAARIRTQTCLTRGVTRYVLLRRAGFPADLVFGLGRYERELAGHCWIELDGEPYLETTDPRGVFPEVFRVSGPKNPV